MAIVNTHTKDKHPITLQIPIALWNEIFESGLDEEDIPHPGQNFNQIQREDLPADEQQALIVLLLYFKTDIAAADLIDYAYTTLGLTFRNIFGLCSSLGRIDMLEQLKVRAPQILSAIEEHIDDADNFNLLAGAFLNDQVETLNWFQKATPKAMKVMIEGDNYNSFYQVAVFGHLNTLIWIHKQAPDKLFDMIAQQEFAPFTTAWEKNYVAVLKWMLLEPNLLAVCEDHIKTTTNVDLQFVSYVAEARAKVNAANSVFVRIPSAVSIGKFSLFSLSRLSLVTTSDDDLTSSAGMNNSK